jgi:cytidine deaminase
MQKRNVSFSYTEYTDPAELSKEDQLLVDYSKKMTGNAYAVYSHFNVGAALRLENGEIVKGSNQENAAYPSGLCAERVAIFAASANYPDVSVEAIAISAFSLKTAGNQPVTPCGSCRQVLIEYQIKQNKPIKVILSGKNGRIWVIEDVEHLLPLGFSSLQM